MTSLAERNQVVRSLIRDLARDDLSELLRADRVAVYAVATGERLGLSDEKLLVLRYAAQLHNLGFIASRSELREYVIQNSNTDPDESEQCVAQIHRILSPIEWLREVITIICAYYEYMKSTRYSKGLPAHQIPIESQIIGVCEAFDSFTHSKNVEGNLSEEEALVRIRERAGTDFVSTVVEAFAMIVPLVQPLNGS